MMKKITILAVALLSISSIAFAQQLSDSASLTISGTVEKFVSIAITPTGNTGLNLATDLTDHSVASVNEYSNVAAGYTVEVESANNWQLLGQTNGDALSYTATYDSASVDQSIATATITDANDRTGGFGDVTGVDKVFAISYSGANANLYNDYYEDTLTFTITAK